MQRDTFIPSPRSIVRQLISGGQTGADRAALDVAIELGIAHGGWVPKDRWTEDGPLPRKYKLKETPSSYVPTRTAWNARDADATLIVSRGPLTGGSLLTRKLAKKLGKPFLHLNLRTRTHRKALARLQAWLAEVRPAILNVAGPRASSDPNIYEAVRRLLREAFAQSR